VEEIQRQRAQLLGDFWPYPPNSTSWVLRPRQAPRDGGDTLAFVVFRPLFTGDLRRQLGSFDAALAVARERWPEKQYAEQKLARQYGVDLRRPAVRREYLGGRIGLSLPALAVWTLDRDLPRAGADLAYRRTASATIAVERFRRAHAGALPPSLDSLVPAYLPSVPQDPFDGKPLKFRTSADSYVVYSVDVNRIDDGGMLYGVGAGTTEPVRRENDPSPRDIGIRVPLHPLH
jgi:hypothetical protein